MLDAVRHFARDVGNPYQMRPAGKPDAIALVITQRTYRVEHPEVIPIEAAAP